jgi:hypothetical protein
MLPASKKHNRFIQPAGLMELSFDPPSGNRGTDCENAGVSASPVVAGVRTIDAPDIPFIESEHFVANVGFLPVGFVLQKSVATPPSAGRAHAEIAAVSFTGFVSFTGLVLQTYPAASGLFGGTLVEFVLLSSVGFVLQDFPGVFPSPGSALKSSMAVADA